MSDALVPEVLSAEVPRREKVAFKPDERDRALLMAYQELIAEHGRITSHALATKVGVSRQAVDKRLENAGRRAWINAHLDRAVEDAWPKVMARATELAMRGSIDHMKFLAQVGGRLKQPDGGGPGGVNVQVVIRV